jgi:hypothetical protein
MIQTWIQATASNLMVNLFLPLHQDEENNSVLLGDTWDQGCDFHLAELHPTKRFQEYFTSSLRNQQQRIGLQCSPMDVNTPIRAWREVFKNTLLDKIVWYTNKYRLAHAKRWKDISRIWSHSLLCCSFQAYRKEKTNLQIGFPTTG